MMSADPKRIIVTESRCHTCSVHTVLVHHQTFPELRIEGLSAEKAAGHLVNRLGAALDSALDPLQREPIQLALADAQAFLNREGYAHPGRDVLAPPRS
jgi:hypothetical protein